MRNKRFSFLNQEEETLFRQLMRLEDITEAQAMAMTLDRLRPIVIPAPVGYYKICFHEQNDMEYFTTEVPIIAFRIASPEADFTLCLERAITLDTLDIDQHKNELEALIKHPDGNLYDYSGLQVSANHIPEKFKGFKLLS